jgi:uncharacterized membrane protein
MESGANATQPQAAAGSAAPGPGRFPFIDALRGLAVLFMIETHTVNALLAPALHGGRFHDALTYVNGLVAPAFLFCAGLGFAIFLSRKNDGIVSLGSAFRSTLVKALFIILLGYSLHVPLFSLRGMAGAGPAAWISLLQVDILQVIGAALLVLLFTAAAVRSPGGRYAAASALTVAAVLWWYAVPDAATGAAVPASAWGWIRTALHAYVSRELSPLFTIVPWGAFLTCGFMAGTYFVRSSAAGREAAAVGRLAAVSAALIVLAPALSSFTGGLYGAGDYWYWSAEYFAVRLGSVGAAMCALWAFRGTGGGPASRALELFGRESLPVYYVHLIVVYGKDFPWSFVRLYPEGGGYALCGALFVLLSAAMVLFGRSWSAAKKRWPGPAAAAVRLLVAGSVLAFLLS